MPRIRRIQHSFASGEWSPRLEGRSDLEKYAAALRTCENFVPLKYGGASRRPGSRYVAAVGDATRNVRMIKFEFSTSQVYVLELGHQYVHFFKNSAQILAGPPYSIATPYDTNHLADIQFVQSADVMYLVHPLHAPMKLSRTSDTSWTLATVDFYDGPYLEENTSAVTLKVSANTGTGLTMTASSAIFFAAHVGSIWRIKGVTTWGYVKVTGYTSSTVLTVDVVNALDYAVPGVDTTTKWREGAWSGQRGYPYAVGLHQQRLFFGGTDSFPDTIWGSKSADYENFDAGTAADADALEYSLASNSVNAIRWLVGSRSLLVGTTGQEWQLSSSGPALTPSDVLAKAETTHGSELLQPVETAAAALFVQRTARIMRELSYNQATDSYQAPDLTLLSEHLTRRYGITQMAYQQVPNSIVWAVREDGQLLGMTYERTQEVIAWHRHIIGGVLGSGDAQIMSVCVIPHPDTDRDQVWIVAKRTINGATTQYVEYLEDKNGVVQTPFGETLGNANVDSAVLQTHVGGTTTISNLSHLEGQTVDIVGIPYSASGQSNVKPAVYPQKTVSAGQVTGVDPPIYKSEVGLHYDSDLLTMKPEIQTGAGTSQAARKRYNEVVVRLDDSLGGTVNSEQLSFRRPSDPMTSGPSLVSDDVIAKAQGWDRAGRIRVQQTQPLPFTVLCIVGIMNVED